MKEKNSLQQKLRVMTKLYQNGCGCEKKLQELGMEEILTIPGITVPDMVIITELQKAVKSNRLFSYLGGDENEQSGNGQAHHLE